MADDLTERFLHHISRNQRILLFFGSVLLAILLLLPTFFRDTMPKAWISRPISLGLDLSGGVLLTYQVLAKEAVTGHLQESLNSIRDDLRNDKIAVTRSRVNEGGNIEISLLSDTTAERAKQKVEETYKDLSFIEQKSVDGRTALVFGIGAARATQIENEALDQAVETLRNRVDQFGVAEPLIQRSGADRVILQMPGVSDVESVKKVVGSVAKLEFRLLPQGPSSTQVMMKDRQGNPVAVEEQTLMTGSSVKDARAGFERGQVEVSLALNAQGARTFRKITSENTGRQLAIILDGVVYSSPRINEPITGGHASISGGFQFEEARQLAVVLRAGALPAPLKPEQQLVVGPTLGAESIHKGIVAILVGFGMIVVAMVVYYRKSGVVAVCSLIVNPLLMLAILSVFGATLTLPGLAGLALTIGMAVDSNVVIFERIRDEIRNGAGRDAAVHAGFHKAWGALFDANVSTLLTGLILYYFGTGPIRGFAVTLSVGILTTLYCAVFVSRLAFDHFELRGGEKPLSI